MYSFFSRHEVDKKAEGFNQGEEGFPSNGRVAWDLWGGDAGFSFAKKNRDRIILYFLKNFRGLKTDIVLKNENYFFIIFNCYYRIK